MNSSHLFGWLSGFTPAVHTVVSQPQSLNFYKMESKVINLEDGNVPDEKEQEVSAEEGLLNKLKQYLYQYYLPVQTPGESDPRFLFSDPQNTKSKGPFVIHLLEPFMICKLDSIGLNFVENPPIITWLKVFTSNTTEEQISKVLGDMQFWYRNNVENQNKVG